MDLLYVRLTTALNTPLIFPRPRYASHFNDLLDGRSKEMTADQAIPQQLYGGARINYVFHDLFGAHVSTVFFGVDNN